MQPYELHRSLAVFIQTVHPFHHCRACFAQAQWECSVSGLRASTLIADPPEAANGSVGHQSIETKDQSTDIDFSFELWREIFKALVHNEKRALEKFETIEFELEVTQRWSKLPTS